MPRLKRSKAPPKRLWVLFTSGRPTTAVEDANELMPLAEDETVYRYDLHRETRDKP